MVCTVRRLRILQKGFRLYSTGAKNTYNVPNYPLHFSEADSTQNTQSTTFSVAADADYNQVGRVRCYNCGQMGHISYHCTVPQVRKACYSCGNSGHISRDCPDKVKTLFCLRCRISGHTTRDCPQVVPNQSPPV